MSEVTQILSRIDRGDSAAASELLPLIYDELRKLAAQKLAQEQPGQTLQATALVHEAYLRLVDVDQPQRWDSRGHFFAAAAEAMRRILVEGARRKGTQRHGGNAARINLDDVPPASENRSDDLLALDDALEELQRHHSQAAQLVKLRYFAGMSHVDAAAAMGIERRAADRLWVLAKTWLFRSLSRD
jgi:RNA polymerase sigma factor (TIGR02999 family)